MKDTFGWNALFLCRANHEFAVLENSVCSRNFAMTTEMNLKRTLCARDKGEGNYLQNVNVAQKNPKEILG